jgi:hypothetical protein
VDKGIQFIHDSAYTFDAIVIVLGAIGVLAGFRQLASGRLPYPAVLARLRRHLPASAEDAKLEGLVIVLRATAVVMLGFGIFTWHLVFGQRPDQTLLVVFWIANVTVFLIGGVLTEVGRRAGNKRQNTRREPSSERRTT